MFASRGVILAFVGNALFTLGSCSIEGAYKYCLATQGTTGTLGWQHAERGYPSRKSAITLRFRKVLPGVGSFPPLAA